LGVGVSVAETLTPAETFYLLEVRPIGLSVCYFCAKPKEKMFPALGKIAPCPEKKYSLPWEFRYNQSKNSARS
jgi:hypothetical protein